MKGIYEFGEFRLNTVERSIENAAGRLSLSPKALDVLIVLVESRGRIVEKSDLMRQVWPDTFVEDNNLSFNVSILRKLFGESGTSPRYIETVPKRGYRFVADVREAALEIGAPVPEPAPPVEIEKAVRGSRVRGFWLLGLGILTAVIILVWAWRPAMPGRPLGSLAVLPFRALDAASADESLEIGLTDALITRLSSSLSIPVRELAAVSRYRGQPANPLETGRALKVDAVLEGTLQKHDGKIRSSVRLLRVRDGKVLHTAVFDQEMAELFRLEDVISTELASTLILKLAPSSLAPQRPGTRNSAAYAAYLKGRYYWNQRTRESIHRAIEYFQQAIAADPSDALAYAGLADAYLLQPSTERISNDVIMPLARAAAERAIRIDGGLAEAHASLGLLALNYDLDWAAADREFGTAIRLNPNYPTARHWYAEYIGSMGRIGESQVEFERARELDPLSAAIPADEAKIFWYDRQFAKSAEFARLSLSLDPHFTNGHLMLGASLAGLGDCSGAVAEIGPPILADNSDVVLAVRTFVNEQCGFHQEALASLAGLTREGQADRTPFMVAAGYASVGDGDHALEWLERTVAERGFGIVSLRSNPAFDGIRSSARFQQLLISIGLK
jgi:DNA-binding winged helix-turn-helix (wHTH) protein/TolB-like protein